jgi:hypothetical protein
MLEPVCISNNTLRVWFIRVEGGGHHYHLYDIPIAAGPIANNIAPIYTRQAVQKAKTPLIDASMTVFDGGMAYGGRAVTIVHTQGGTAPVETRVTLAPSNENQPVDLKMACVNDGIFLAWNGKTLNIYEIGDPLLQGIVPPKIAGVVLPNNMLQDFNHHARLTGNFLYFMTSVDNRDQAHYYQFV